MNSTERTLTHSYAQALFETSKKKGELQKTADEALALRQTVESESRLRRFLNAPNISREDKEKALVNIFGGKISELSVNFMRLLIRRGRLALLMPALEEFDHLVLEEQGIAPGTVITAVPLNEVQKKGLESVLNKFTGKELQVEYKTDPDLIGGVRFQSGELQVGNTLRGTLRALQEKLRESRVF